jgi:hypothetical protein
MGGIVGRHHIGDIASELPNGVEVSVAFELLKASPNCVHANWVG